MLHCLEGWNGIREIFNLRIQHAFNENLWLVCSCNMGAVTHFIQILFRTVGRSFCEKHSPDKITLKKSLENFESNTKNSILLQEKLSQKLTSFCRIFLFRKNLCRLVKTIQNF